MKSVTSFFDKHTLRKDITRFSPAWLVYLIGGILVMLALTSSTRPHYVAETLSETLVPFSMINLVYAALVAQLLFGDLFNSRLCNALHAMPLRREQWFASHALAGLCFSIVPNTLGIGLIMPRMEHLWFVGLIWLLGMTLQYLFFFGLAVFCMFCTGNRFAMAAIYAILNFASMIASIFIAAIYQPLLFGIEIDTAPFELFSPAYYLAGNYQDAYISIEPVDSLVTTPYKFAGLGDGWTYLWIIAAIGVALLILGLLMYRRRALETAGDFIALRPLAPVFSIVYTLTVGVLFAAVGDLITGDYIVFLLVGIVVGYFTGQIMLQRTVKVFHLKTFLKCGAVLGALLVSMLLTWLDPIGITRHVPEPSQTQQVQLHLSGYTYRDNGWLSLTEAEDIEKITEVHRDILAIGRYENAQYSPPTLSLRYTMKNGATVQREYEVLLTGTVKTVLKEYLSSPEFVLGGHNWAEDYVSITTYDKGTDGKLPLSLNPSLLVAMTADCEAGNMVQHHAFHDQYDTIAWINLHSYDENGNINYYDIEIYADAENTVNWLKENWNP